MHGIFLPLDGGRDTCFTRWPSRVTLARSKPNQQPGYVIDKERLVYVGMDDDRRQVSANVHWLLENEQLIALQTIIILCTGLSQDGS
jgi:hypothetical protein